MVKEKNYQKIVMDFIYYVKYDIIKFHSNNWTAKSYL